MPCVLSDADKSIVIDAVKETSYIYDKAHEDYKNSVKKDRAFSEIGKLFDPSIPGAEIKNQWQVLRGQYVRELEKLPSGSAKSKKKPWIHFESMKFLEKFIGKRSTLGNAIEAADSPAGTEQSEANDVEREAEESESHEEETGPTYPPPIPTPSITIAAPTPTPTPLISASTPGNKSSRRKRGNSADITDQQLLDIITKPTDEETVFGNAIAVQLKQLHPVTKIRTMTKIQNLLGEARLADLTGNGPGTSDLGAGMAAPGTQETVFSEGPPNFAVYRSDRIGQVRNVLSTNGSNLQQL